MRRVPTLSALAVPALVVAGVLAAAGPASAADASAVAAPSAELTVAVSTPVPPNDSLVVSGHLVLPRCISCWIVG